MLFLIELHNTIYLLSKKYNFSFEEALRKLEVPELKCDYTYRKTELNNKLKKKMKRMEIVRVIDTDDEEEDNEDK